MNCEGSGKVITEHCAECYGSGRVPVESIIKVDIPGGIDDGSTIRISGGGNADKQRQALVSCYIISWSCIICVVCYMFDLSVTYLKPRH